MCFDYDDDNPYEVWEIVDNPVTVDCRCEDCCRVITPEEERLTYHFVEYDYCLICRFDSSDDVHNRVCNPEFPDDPHDFGDEGYIHICRDCQTIRKAIAEIEEAEGCPKWASQPCIGGLSDALWDNENGSKYWERALTLDPRLINHPHALRIAEP